MKHLLTALALTTTLVWGCTGNKATAGPASTASRSPLHHATVAKLPKNVPLVIAARAPGELMTLVDYPGLLAKVEPLHAEISRDMIREFGHDLSDPKVMTDTFGLDLSQPIGFYVLQVSGFHFGLFAHVRNPAVFEATLKGMLAKARDPFLYSERDGAKVWQAPRGDIAFIVRGAEVHVLGQDRVNPRQMARGIDRLLKPAPSANLAASDDFKHAIDDLSVRRDAALYVNVDQVIAGVVAEMTGAARVQRLRDDVAAMEAAGAPDDVLNPKKARLERMERRSLERLAQGTAASLAINSFAGGMSALAAGTRIGAEHIDFELGVRTTKTALLQRVLRPGSGTPLAYTGLAKPPIYTGRMHLDFAGLLGLIRQAATLAGAGNEVERSVRTFHRETAVDLENELLPLLTGAVEFGFGFDFEPGQLPSDDRSLERHATPYLLVGVKDAAKAKALVDRFVHKPEFKTLGWAPKGNGWRLAAPDEPVVDLAVTQGHIAATFNGSAFVERLGGASIANQLKPAQVGARATLAGVTGTHYFDWPTWVVVNEAHDQRMHARWAAQRMELLMADNLAPEVQKRLKALNAEEQAKINARRKANAADGAAAVAQFAALAASIDTSDTARVSLRLTQGLTAPVSEAIANAAQRLTNIMRRSEAGWRESDAYRERRGAIESGRPDPGP